MQHADLSDPGVDWPAELDDRAGSVRLEGPEQAPPNNISAFGSKLHAAANETVTNGKGIPYNVFANGATPGLAADGRRRPDRNAQEPRAFRPSNAHWGRPPAEEALEVHNPKYFPPAKVTAPMESRADREGRWGAGRNEEDRWGAPRPAPAFGRKAWGQDAEAARQVGGRTGIWQPHAADAKQPQEEKRDPERGWRQGGRAAGNDGAWRKGDPTEGRWRDMENAQGLQLGQNARAKSGQLPMQRGDSVGLKDGNAQHSSPTSKYSKDEMTSVLHKMKSESRGSVPLPRDLQKPGDAQEVWKSNLAGQKSLSRPLGDKEVVPPAVDLAPPPGLVSPQQQQRLREVQSALAEFPLPSPLTMLLEDKYYYKDNFGKYQGPFPQKNIVAWARSGYFPKDHIFRGLPDESSDTFPFMHLSAVWDVANKLQLSRAELQQLVDCQKQLDVMNGNGAPGALAAPTTPPPQQQKLNQEGLVGEPGPAAAAKELPPKPFLGSTANTGAMGGGGELRHTNKDAFRVPLGGNSTAMQPSGTGVGSLFGGGLGGLDFANKAIGIVPPAGDGREQSRRPALDPVGTDWVPALMDSKEGLGGASMLHSDLPVRGLGAHVPLMGSRKLDVDTGAWVPPPSSSQPYDPIDAIIDHVPAASQSHMLSPEDGIIGLTSTGLGREHGGYGGGGGSLMSKAPLPMKNAQAAASRGLPLEKHNSMGLGRYGDPGPGAGEMASIRRPAATFGSLPEQLPQGVLAPMQPPMPPAGDYGKNVLTSLFDAAPAAGGGAGGARMGPGGAFGGHAGASPWKAPAQGVSVASQLPDMFQRMNVNNGAARTQAVQQKPVNAPASMAIQPAQLMAAAGQTGPEPGAGKDWLHEQNQQPALPESHIGEAGAGWRVRPPVVPANGASLQQIQQEELAQQQEAQRKAVLAATETEEAAQKRHAAWVARPDPVSLRAIMEDDEENAADLEGGRYHGDDGDYIAPALPHGLSYDNYMMHATNAGMGGLPVATVHEHQNNAPLIGGHAPGPAPAAGTADASGMFWDFGEAPVAGASAGAQLSAAAADDARRAAPGRTSGGYLSAARAPTGQTARAAVAAAPKTGGPWDVRPGVPAQASHVAQVPPPPPPPRHTGAPSAAPQAAHRPGAALPGGQAPRASAVASGMQGVSEPLLEEEHLLLKNNPEFRDWCRVEMKRLNGTMAILTVLLETGANCEVMEYAKEYLKGPNVGQFVSEFLARKQQAIVSKPTRRRRRANAALVAGAPVGVPAAAARAGNGAAATTAAAAAAATVANAAASEAPATEDGWLTAGGGGTKGRKAAGKGARPAANARPTAQAAGRSGKPGVQQSGGAFAALPSA